MNTLTIKIPSTLQVSEFDLAMTLASKLYEDGKLSSGQAGEMVGISKRTFIELLGKYNVSIFGYSAEELKEDLKNV
jgi:predicted HTH domain antitoxin